MNRTRDMTITCNRCNGYFTYRGYSYKPRKFCDICLEQRKHEIVLENAKNPVRLEKVRLMGLANKGHSRNLGSKHGAWKGDDVGIDALHTWVERRLGKPRECSECGTKDAKVYDWANISQEYKRDVEDFKRLCRSCHLKFDHKIGVRHGR